MLYRNNMTTQVMILNKTNYDVKLVSRKNHTKYFIEWDRDYSLPLPYDADRFTEYKVKIGDHTIALLKVNQNGLITSVVNKDQRVNVTCKNHYFEQIWRFDHHCPRIIHGWGRYGLDVGDWPDERWEAEAWSGRPQMLAIYEGEDLHHHTNFRR